MSMNDAAVDDDYVVKLPSGDARVMSLDELDAAFDAGTIHKDSPVLAPGNVTWTTLGVLAGLDEIAAPVALSPSSIAPMVLTPSSRDALDVDVDVDVDVGGALDDDDGASFVPRRRAGKVIGVAFGALALLAVGFAVKGAISQTLATRAGEAALAAQPPAPPPQAAPPPAPLPSPVVAAVEAAPPPPAPAAAPAPATSRAAADADKDSKDKKKRKLPGAPGHKKKK